LKAGPPPGGGPSPPPPPGLLTAPFTSRTVGHKPTRLPPPPTAPHPRAAAHEGRRPVYTAHTASPAAVATPPPEWSPAATPALQPPPPRSSSCSARTPVIPPHVAGDELSVCSTGKPTHKSPSARRRDGGGVCWYGGTHSPSHATVDRCSRCHPQSPWRHRRTACRCGCSCTMSMRVPSQSPPTGVLTPPPSGAARGGGWRAGVADARGGGVTGLLAAVWAPGCTGVRREAAAGGVLAGGMTRASCARMGGLCWPATQIKQPPTSFRRRGRPRLFIGGQATSFRIP